jgi:hypothetical protein
LFSDADNHHLSLEKTNSMEWITNFFNINKVETNNKVNPLHFPEKKVIVKLLESPKCSTAKKLQECTLSF